MFFSTPPFKELQVQVGGLGWSDIVMAEIATFPPFGGIDFSVCHYNNLEMKSEGLSEHMYANSLICLCFFFRHALCN